MTCLTLLQERDEICRRSPHSDECARARFLYSACERARKGRMGDTRADDRMMALWAFLAEAEELLFGKLDIPPRPCGMMSIALREKILGDKKSAMIFSQKIAEAFAEAGVDMPENETYACLVCSVERPEYASEALALDPLQVKDPEGGRVNYVMEPAIMSTVMESIAHDKIDFGTNKSGSEVRSLAK